MWGAWSLLSGEPPRVIAAPTSETKQHAKERSTMVSVKRKIIPVTKHDVSGYEKVVRFFFENGEPAVTGGWGHECRFSPKKENGVFEIEIFGLDGKPQHPAVHDGFCFTFTCSNHFDKKQGLAIRLTVDPIIIHVGGVAKMGCYGQLQRVYDVKGNELVLNRDPKGGYILFCVSPEQKVLAKYYLKDGSTLRLGDDGYAFAKMDYSADGKLIKKSVFGLNGKPLTLP